MTEDEMVGWHHQLNEHEFEQTLGDSEGQGSLVCCSAWGCKESDTTEQQQKHCDKRKWRVECEARFLTIIQKIINKTSACVSANSLHSCLTLCDPMNCSLPGSSLHGVLRSRILEWVAVLQGIFPIQGSNPGLLQCRQILYRLSHQGSQR